MRVHGLAVSLKAGVQESWPMAQELRSVTSGLREAAREMREAARRSKVGLARSRCLRRPRGNETQGTIADGASEGAMANWAAGPVMAQGQ